MAIDTRDKRAGSVGTLGTPIRGLPAADGAIGQSDRQFMVWYPGVLAGALAATIAGGVDVWDTLVQGVAAYNALVHVIQVFDTDGG